MGIEPKYAAIVQIATDIVATVIIIDYEQVTDILGSVRLDPYCSPARADGGGPQSLSHRINADQ
jgi:hypothetical protein